MWYNVEEKVVVTRIGKCYAFSSEMKGEEFMRKIFRYNLEKAKEHLNKILPDEKVRKVYLKSILECAKLASNMNNANWNVNLSNSLIRVNCGARYIFNMKASNIRVMCWRDTFLELDKEFINEFLTNVFFHREDTKELLASSYNPKNYDELVDIPSDILWHNSLQFNIPPKLWAEKYADILMPSVLDFCKDCIKKSSIMTQMQQAHSTGLIELINEEMNENLIQPEYVKKEIIKTWQEIYDESLKNKNTNNKYFETINIIRENVGNVHWTDDCIYRVLKSSKNGISSVNRGQLTNEHYELVKENWNFYEGVFNKIYNEKNITQELFDNIRNKTQSLTGRNYSLIINRAICSLLPGIITTAPSIDFFYERLNLIKDVFPEIPEITGNWLNDNLTFVSYCKEQVNFQEEHHASGFIFDLFDYCKNLTSQGESQMQNPQEKLINETKTLLENTKNLILTGAPGTGKTFLAKQIAKEMGCEKDEIGFVQFHPSYDYTDFVEGLRPIQNDGNNQIGFERKDGVFKEFCKQALLSNTITENSLLSGLNKNPTVWKVSLQGTGDNPVRKDCLENNYIRIGWHEYGDVDNFDEFENFDKGGKFILRNYQSEMKIGDIVLSCYSAKEIDAIGIVSGDYEYRKEGNDYPRYRKVNWLVKNIKENIVEMNGGKTFTLSTIYKASISLQDIKGILEKYIIPENKKVTHQTQKPFVFIIDEINRGEVSKIFGELFYCIDPGYRGEKGRISTQYQNLVTSGEFQKGFFIPENVYIIGTMNDIDRSVESMDFAFRRRFAWKEITADDTQYMLDEVEKDGETFGLPDEIAVEAKKRMNRLNNKISELPDFNSAYHIGASYFLKLNQLDGNFQSLWDYHLKGILEEYLRGNPEKDKYMTQLEDIYFE